MVPGAQTVRSTASSAARPDANASPRTPPSTAASASSSAFLVGLAERLYSYAGTQAPHPSCL